MRIPLAMSRCICGRRIDLSPLPELVDKQFGLMLKGLQTTVLRSQAFGYYDMCSTCTGLVNRHVLVKELPIPRAGPGKQEMHEAHKDSDAQDLHRTHACASSGFYGCSLEFPVLRILLTLHFRRQPESRHAK